ncbi:MAG: Aminopeptidase [uncultured Solirubrobacteraceae bacterium]|uniref:Aminopeptidase n=1 Tax=uncultured Solirubrobacteraceae bacterium TaxID=1162706 RepID=A0A6J4RTH0_9ACTN|nr:MAG: Aminopeptidase [uncultured Solirubrobacteraceae bacterium]
MSTGGGPDPRAFAALLCDYCLEVRPGQQVVVRSSTLAAPLLLELQSALLGREAWPLLRVDLPGQSENWWQSARDAHLDSHAAVDLHEARETDASIRIDAPENAAALANVDPARMARAARARSEIREAALRRRWNLTLWPTPALAQQAGMGTAEYSAFVTRALFLDREDPVAAWRELSAFQAGLVERLAPTRTLRIEAEGTDLTLDVSGRTWINSDGKRNMPSGEVFTGPHEGSAEGRVSFSVPTSPGGVEVAGVTLEFRAGRVVSAHAERGETYLREMLATDDGAKRLGEIGIGANFGIDRPTGTILLDEKLGGTIHLALGRSYPETGGTNASAIHWDLICDLRRGGRLTADGEVIQENGAFR